MLSSEPGVMMNLSHHSVSIQWGSLTQNRGSGVPEASRRFAGRHTFADIGIRFLADFKISESLAYLFGGVASYTGGRTPRAPINN